MFDRATWVESRELCVGSDDNEQNGLGKLCLPRPFSNQPTIQPTNSRVYAAILPSGTHTGRVPFSALTQKKRAGGKPLTPISSESPVRTGIFSPRSTTASVNESDSTTPAWRTDSGPELIAN